MSYVKDLMTAAAEWMKLNPSASGKLKVPRDEFAIDNYDLDHLFAAFEKRSQEAAAKDPARSAEILAHLDDMRAQHEKLLAGRKHIREHEDAVERSINETDATGHAKLDMGDCTVAATPLVLGRWCLAWAYAGYNVFELGNDFVAAMLLTDPREIRFEDLRIPFPGLLITIPSGFTAGNEGLPYTKIHLSHVDGEWKLYATDGIRVLDTTVGEGEALSWDLLESLETEDDEITGSDAEVVRTVRQIAFGMLAYVNAVDRAIEERDGAKRSKNKRTHDNGPRPRVHDVGRTVKIDPILVKYARAGSREITLQIKSRFIVRGHYRNQAHGPEHRDRKLIWIEPFWKGPVEGAKIVHTYRPDVSK